MKLLVLAPNYAPEPVGAAVYTSGFCRFLADAGHTVEVVTTKPHYPAWRIADGEKPGWRRDALDGVGLHRVPIYVPSTPSAARRTAHYLSFAASAAAPMWRAGRLLRPDAVLAIAPALLAAPVALRTARALGVSAWLHIQDFEVGAAFATGLMRQGSTAGRLAARVERRIVAGFDRISSISPEMCSRARQLTDRPVFEFRNWADLDPTANTPRDAYRAEWGLGDRIVALYSGNVAAKQGFEVVLGAADRLADRSDIVFVICGGGSGLDALAEAAHSRPNLQLRPLQPRERLPELLAAADIHLLPQRADAADLVLPSKLPNMLASGRPVIATAAAGTGLAREVEGCGVIIPPGDPEAMAQAIARLAASPGERGALGGSARARAAERWDRRAILMGAEAAMRTLMRAGRCAS